MAKGKGANYKKGKTTAKKKKSGGNQKAGSPKKDCPLATLHVTVVREDGQKRQNFTNTIRIEPSGGSAQTNRMQCDKEVSFTKLKPGKYEASAKPADGFGYSFEKPVAVSLGAGDEKRIKLQLKAAEIKLVTPKKKLKQYINLEAKADDLRRGRVLNVEAHLTKKLKGVKVHFDFEQGKENRSGLPADLRPKIPRNARTDENGVAKVDFKLSHYGGDTFEVLASLNEDPKHASSNGRKSAQITVWRKSWYQVSHPEKTPMPAAGGFESSQNKVFLETAVLKQKKLKAKDFSVDPYRPNWQFNPGSASDTPKLCIGTHNVSDAMKLFDAPTAETKPKFHVILCDEQFDAKGLTTKALNVAFWDADSGPQTKQLSIPKTEDDYVSIFKPPLQDGNLIESADWVAQSWEGNPGAWVVKHRGKLPEANVAILKSRASKREVRIAPPAQCPGAGGGCPCGGAPANLAIDGTHAVNLTLQVKGADGGYNGWAPSNSVANVVRGGRATYAIHNTMGHELGHLFGQVRWKKVNGLPDHPKMYQKRGGSGTHCAMGATWDPAPAGTPALDPKKNGELDAQGKGAGEWDDGDCIIFGYSVAKKREWCEHCAFELRVSDLSKFG